MTLGRNSADEGYARFRVSCVRDQLALGFSGEVSDAQDLGVLGQGVHLVKCIRRAQKGGILRPPPPPRHPKASL